MGLLAGRTWRTRHERADARNQANRNPNFYVAHPASYRRLLLESKYFVRLNGRIYPPKQVIAAAPQIPPGDFITIDATRVLRNLGYKIERQTDDAVEKPAIVVLEQFRVGRRRCEIELRRKEAKLAGC